MSYMEQMFFDGATSVGTLTFTDDAFAIDFQPSPKSQAMASRAGRLPALLSLAVALFAGALITANPAHAWGGHQGTYAVSAKNVPSAYDPFWKLKHPGGPVETTLQTSASKYLINGHVSPGAIAGFNPQPDPPGFQ